MIRTPSFWYVIAQAIIITVLAVAWTGAFLLILRHVFGTSWGKMPPRE